jgi:hypothetical protein
MARRRGTRIDTIAALDMETMRPMFGFGAQHFGPIAKLMGVRFPSVFSTTFIGPLPVGAGETVCLTTPAFTPPLDGATIVILWNASISAGASVTSNNFRIRRGVDITGVQIATNPFNLVTSGGTLNALSGIVVDTPGAVTGVQYTLTVQQISSTGAGTWRDGIVFAFAL